MSIMAKFNWYLMENYIAKNFLASLCCLVYQYMFGVELSHSYKIFAEHQTVLGCRRVSLWCPHTSREVAAFRVVASLPWKT